MKRVTGVALGAALLVVVGVALWRGAAAPARSRAAYETVAAPPAERSPPAAAPAPAPAPVASAETDPAGPPFASEEDYLRALDRLNRTDKRQALALVEQGESWYAASGVNAEARQAMGITLLVDLGEMEEARARTRQFLADHPTSSYRRLVQGVTGIHPRPTGPDPEQR